MIMKSFIALALAASTLLPMSASQASTEEADQHINSIGRAYYTQKDRNYGTTGTVTFNLANNVEGTEVTATLYGCTNEVIQSKTVQGDSDLQIVIDTYDDRFYYGDTIRFTLAWTSSAGDKVMDSTLYEDPKYDGEADKHCVGGTPEPVGTLKVDRWSSKVGSARVGRTAGITKTVSNADRTTYAWYAGTTYVGAGKRLKVSSVYRGRDLRAVVRVELKHQAQSRTIKFGMVR